MVRRLEFPQPRCLGCNGELEKLNEIEFKCRSCGQYFDIDDLK